MNARRARFVLLAVLALSAVAHAARRPFVVGHDSSMLAEGDVEAETWVDFDQNPVATRSLTSGLFWWVGVYWAPVDDLELRAFTSVIQRDPAPGKQNAASLWAELLSARWRFINGGAGALTLQLDFRIPMLAVLQWQVAPSLSWSKKIDRFTFNAQAGYAANFRGKSDVSNWITWDAGIAADVVKGEVAPIIQVGVEAFSEVVLTGKNDLTGTVHGTSVNVGPTVSVAKGRLWFTLGVLRGVGSDSPEWFVRGMIGLAL